MMRRGCFFALFLSLLLAGCGARQTDQRAEALQRRYAEMDGCTARVAVSLAGKDETQPYLMELDHTAEGSRVTVLEPEALAGVSAIVGNDDALTLEYNGMVLSAGSLGESISAANAADIFLRAAAEGWVTEQNREAYDGTDALRLCFETAYAGEKLLVASWFGADDAPLYAEIERGGEILAYLEFTEFQFGDILPSD